MGTDGRNARTLGDHSEEPESLAQLRGDCERMSSRWHRHEAAGEEGAAEPARPHGVRVPERSARLLDGMSDYGD